jgi:hypothetical protein
VAVLKVKPEKVIEYSLPVMGDELLAPYFVTRFSGENFVGAKGDTVNMRIKELQATARDYEWRTRNAPIVLDDIMGGASMPVKLNKHVYSATALTDEHMRMDEISLSEDVVAPQAQAIAKDFEAKAVAGFRTLNNHADLIMPAMDLGDVDPHTYVVEAVRRLNSFKVAPTRGRAILVGSDVAAAFRVSDRLSRYDSIGENAVPAVRQALIGQLSGLPVLEHTGLDPKEGYLLSPSAMILASLAPFVPTGAATGAGLSLNGYAMRWIQDYDANYARDRSIVSAFLGIADVRDQRNPDGSWIYEVDDLDEEDLPIDPNTGNPVVPSAVGTRKNVRNVRFAFTGTGSVLD